MGTLYDRYGNSLYSLILHIIGDRQIAEDVLAETFVKAWNQIGAWKENRAGDLALWILSLARNHAVEHLRHANGWPAANPLILNTLEQPFLFRQPNQTARNPEQLRALGAALAQLPQNQRRTLELAYFEGLNPNEVAQKLSQPLTEVRTWIATALGRLRSSLPGNP